MEGFEGNIKKTENTEQRISGAELNLEGLAKAARLISGLKEAGVDFGFGNKAAEEKEKSEAKAALTSGRNGGSFDLQFETPAIKTIKAAIPYIDRKYQKQLGVMVKLIEIDRLLNSFSGFGEVNAMSKGGSLAMLRAVVPNLPKENRKMGETLIKLMEIREINERGDF